MDPTSSSTPQKNDLQTISIQEQALQSLYGSELPDDRELFHYTDAGGLYGIANYQKLWLTNLHYLNDSKEYYYAFDLLKEIISNEYQGLLSEEQLECFGAGKAGVFTFSLTEEKDLLSQWRGYCPNGGYSLCFERDMLNQIITTKRLRVAQCIYDRSVQRDFLIDHIIGMTPGEYAANAGNSGGAPGGAGAAITYLTGGQVSIDMALLAPVFKHPSFAQEKEWRIISLIDAFYSGSTVSSMMGNQRYQNMAGLSVRVSRNKLIPYLEVPLNPGGQNISFKEIVVGPNPHPNLASDACMVLANIYERTQYHQATVTDSEIPYVNW
jgi:hypothetical protein